MYAPEYSTEGDPGSHREALVSLRTLSIQAIVIYGRKSARAHTHNMHL